MNSQCPPRFGRFNILPVITIFLYLRAACQCHAQADLQAIAVTSFTPMITEAGARPTKLSWSYRYNGPQPLISFTVISEFFLSRNTFFGDADDLKIGEERTLHQFVAPVIGFSSDKTIGSNAGLQSIMIPPNASGDYYLFVRLKHASVTLSDPNPVNDVARSSFIVKVNPIGPVRPEITTQPRNQIILAGTDVTFTVVATGSPAPNYQWQLNGVNIRDAINATLTLSKVSRNQSGNYTVVVSNTAGSVTSQPATLTVSLTVIPPSIVTQPQDQTVTLGANVTFMAVASGIEPLSYQWKFNGTIIPGATGPSLTRNSVRASDAGGYVVVVTNSAGSVTSRTAALIVTAPVLPPSITSQPQSKIVTLGRNIVLTVSATGTEPLVYQWHFNGNPISAATNAVLELQNLRPADAGSYSVIVRNAGGSVTSTAAILKVVSDTNPTISSIPDQQIKINEDTEIITFTVADGEMPAERLKVTATSDNVTLVPRGIIQFAPAQSSRPNERLMLIRPGADQFGTAKITVTVTDEDGHMARTTFKLTVLSEPPTISAIANQLVPKGGSVGPISFTVTDRETFPGFLVVSGESSNKALVPDSNIGFGGAFAGRTVTITPLPGLEGTTRITVRVRDSDGQAASTSFLLTVGSNPLIQAPRLSVMRLNNGELQIQLRGNEGTQYAIEASTDFVSWVLLTNLVSTSGSESFQDPNARTLSRRFYRARLR